MIRFAVDEDFNYHIILGVLRRNPTVDFLRVQDAGLGEAPDPAVLQWAGEEGRVLLTHDVSTMPGFARERLAAGASMPGVFLVARHIPVRQVIEEILLLDACSNPGEWEGQIRFLPLA